MPTDATRTPLRVSANRRTTRLAGHDYTRPGTYFVAICTRTRAPHLGEIEGRSVRLTDAGRIVRDCWLEIPQHFPHVTLDAFVIMPDHVHGIVVIGAAGDTAGARGNAGARRDTRAFKSAATRRVNLMRNTPRAALWQRNCHERIIREMDDLRRVRWYIVTNPRRGAEPQV